MKQQLNIDDIESRLKQFARNAHLGSMEQWADLSYEWLGQTLTIGYDKGKNEFTITLVLAGERVELTYYEPDNAPDGWLRDLIEMMANHCRDSIMDQGAEQTRSAIRFAIRS